MRRKKKPLPSRLGVKLLATPAPPSEAQKIRGKPELTSNRTESAKRRKMRRKTHPHRHTKSTLKMRDQKIFATIWEATFGEHGICPPRWMSTLESHTKPRHPKRCQQIRKQRPSPTVLMTSPSIHWKNDIDDRTHRYCIRYVHLIPHPALQPLHRQFFRHLPQQIYHVTDSRLSTKHAQSWSWPSHSCQSPHRRTGWFSHSCPETPQTRIEICIRSRTVYRHLAAHKR